MMEDRQPGIFKSSFICPHCEANSHQTWLSVLASPKGAKWGEGASSRAGEKKSIEDVDQLKLSRCFSCNKLAVWHGEKIRELNFPPGMMANWGLIYPPKLAGPLPNSDLPEDIQSDFNEARSIANLSPRGAAGLLRLCLEKLCDHLEVPGKSLNDKIGALVKDGVSKEIQHAFDSVRVIAGENVHAGTLDIRENPELVPVLFQLVNWVAEDRITKQRVANEIYEMLPEEKKKGVERRDRNNQ